MATLQLTAETLTVTLTRFEKFAGLLRDLAVPISAVRSVEAVEVLPSGVARPRGLRAPGLGVPGARKIGTWRGRGEKTMVVVRTGQPAVRIELTGARFDVLLIGADDAAVVAAEIAFALCPAA
jgi:hypothetical protein